ncbi:MAG: hypothetical protein COA36_15445 [Desulfotalea sp.]|nr:MAG: hypothetical protein COA36_15445 [Desulfotalea sp.]
MVPITPATGSKTVGYPSRQQEILESIDRPYTTYNFGVAGKRIYRCVKQNKTEANAIPADVSAPERYKENSQWPTAANNSAEPSAQD